MTDLQAGKKAARQAAIALRQGLDAVACGQALACHVMRDCSPRPGQVVAGFWPLQQEIDLRGLLHTLHRRGNAVVLPVTPGRGQALSFRRWRPTDAMVAERFGTMRPTGEELVPDVLLIPLLAFDSAGRRLGYGGGYYDRTLSGLTGRFRLGCGFAAQQVDAVPVGPYDMTLDAVATECGITRFGG